MGSTRWLLPLLLLPLAACDRSTAPAGQPVAIRISLAGRSGATYSTSPLASDLALERVRLVVGAAALGSGDEFGCVDCQGDHEGAPVAPHLVEVPANGGAVTLQTEEVQPGTYPEAEVEVPAPTPAVFAADPAWPAGATLEIRGRFHSTPFTLALPIEGSFRQRLAPPATVASGASTLSVTLALPVSDWFHAGGAVLDPTTAAGRAAIEANARGFFQAPEPEGKPER